MSTSVLASAANATINVFDTVANTANAATKIVNGIGTGANMFERMMNDMDNRHAMRSKLDNELYEQELLKSYADKISEQDNHYQKKMAEDANYAKLFAENFKKLNAILHPSVSE